MGVYEKILGLGLIPFLLLLLILMATGIARRQIHKVILFFLKFKFEINGRTVYFFPLIAVINIIWIGVLYIELMEMEEPEEVGAKTQYFEKLYRTYRNFLINVTSIVLIFQIFYTAKAY